MTDTTTPPLALLGVRPGLSLIPTDTLLTRLNYFDGKFLRADDLRLDQAYGRSLSALSNRAVGTGIAYGFDVELDPLAGDTLRLSAGLGLTTAGHVVYLPGLATVSIGELIARSEGTFDPAADDRVGDAAFGPCAPATAPPPDVTLSGSAVYVLTLAPEEALCGEEERFGQLCADACLTETDRPRLVEGVRLRARRIDLAGLPTSTAVTFTSRHDQSRVASAYFEAERHRIASLISGPNLANPAWCEGARADDLDELPIALLGRSGSTTAFLDEWSARRELMEQPARRYWNWRIAMRPWDVFLAQVLQFQCQLAGLSRQGGGGVAVDDPCADDRAALAQANELLAQLTDQLKAQPPASKEATGAFNALFGSMSETYSRVAAVSQKVLLTLSKTPTSTSSSTLIDGGIVELPPAGYLPVDPSGDVQAQVRALMGGGVDLRFCSARADFVGHALEEAQHLERISLTTGLDDRARIQDVDVILPDATVDTAPSASDAPAYIGTMQLLPSTQLERAVAGAAMTLRAAARNWQSASSAGWSMTGYGEAPQTLSVPSLLLGLAQRLGIVNLDEAYINKNLRVIKIATVADPLDVDPAFAMRLNREAEMARTRRAIGFARANPLVGDAPPSIREPDNPVAAGDARPMAVWVDALIDGDLVNAPQSLPIPASFRFTAYSRAKTSAALVDVKVTGTLTVEDRTDESAAFGPGLGGSTLLRVRTRFDGFVDPLVMGPRLDDRSPLPVNSQTLLFTLAAGPTGSRIVAVQPEAQGAPGFVATLAAGSLRGAIGFRTLTHEVAANRSMKVENGWVTTSPAVGGLSATAFDETLLSFALTETADGLAVGSVGYDLASGAIEVIASEIERYDSTFAFDARRKMLPAKTNGGVHLRAARDWVFFHRRRDRVCGADAVVVTPTRKYRMLHAVVANRKGLSELERVRAGFVAPPAQGESPETMLYRPARVDDLGFAPVAIVEFDGGSDHLRTSVATIRTAWSAADRGTRLVYQAIGDLGTGDGEVVALRRASTVTQSLGGLIDMSSTPQPEFLAAVPDEFKGSGIDGVILTVGYEEPVQNVCQTVVRLTLDQFSTFMKSFDAQFDEHTDTEILAALRDMAKDPPIIEATFDASSDKVTNDSAVRAWWTTGVPLVRLVLVADPTLTSDDTEHQKTRATRVSELLGGHADFGVRNIRSTEHCPAIVILIVESAPR